MMSLKSVTVDEAMRTLTNDNVYAVDTKPEPDGDYDQVLAGIHRLLDSANLSSTNQFTVVIDVQGSPDSGRIIQLCVIDSCQGPL